MKLIWRKELCGFSSGCNAILKAIKDFNITCNKIIFQSQCIPIVEEDLIYLAEQLKKKDLEVIIICGVEDKDCFPQCELLEKKASDVELNIILIYRINRLWLPRKLQWNS